VGELVKGEVSYICPECGEEMAVFDHPVIVAAMSHGPGCPRKEGPDPGFEAATALLLKNRERSEVCPAELLVNS
jgi:hypothetical protein